MSDCTVSAIERGKEFFVEKRNNRKFLYCECYSEDTLLTHLMSCTALYCTALHNTILHYTALHPFHDRMGEGVQGEVRWGELICTIQLFIRLQQILTTWHISWQNSTPGKSAACTVWHWDSVDQCKLGLKYQRYCCLIDQSRIDYLSFIEQKLPSHPRTLYTTPNIFLHLPFTITSTEPLFTHCPTAHRVAVAEC